MLNNLFFEKFKLTFEESICAKSLSTSNLVGTKLMTLNLANNLKAFEKGILGF